MAFWCFGNLERKERRPLPTCLVYKRTKFAATEHDKEHADWLFKGFSYGDSSMPDNE